MRIEKLSLKNFRGFEELEIEFPTKEQEGGLAVFIGVNGSGKTSVLDSIFYHLKSVHGIIDAMNDVPIGKRLIRGSLPNEVVKLRKENINVNSKELSLESLWAINENRIKISNSLKKDESKNYSNASFLLGKTNTKKNQLFNNFGFGTQKSILLKSNCNF